MLSEETLDGSFGLDRYVLIGAYLRYFPRAQKGAVLEKLGVSTEAWEAARASWSITIREDSEKHGPLLGRWNASFERAWERLQADQPTLEKLSPEAIAPTESESAPREVPSFLLVESETRAARPTPVGASTAPLPRDVVERAALPFVAAPEGPTPVAVPAGPDARRRMSGTAELPERALRKPTPATLPFQAPAPPLSLDQYASLCAELTVYPERRAEIMARYGVLTEAAHQSLEAMFREAFETSPHHQQRFRLIFQQHLDALRSGR